MNAISNTFVVFKRELKSYFETPVAYVFLCFFLLLSNFLPFQVNEMYERNMASLYLFFWWQPWVYLLLVPAATMGLWAEERRSGTIELLFTMPITMSQAIMGKFMAAWAFITIAIALTFPIVITTMILGKPDVGMIIAGYVGSVLMAGAYVAIGMLMSSTTRNQVISFVLSLVSCLLLLIIGFEPVMNFFVKWVDPGTLDGIAALSLWTSFEAMKRGVITMTDVSYFLSVIAFMIVGTHVVLQNRKSA
ncbi:MAG: ABC transporter permease [Verrucomicrobia bacterium]|nr:ABC transporter permease [Verrucomicrobiota bacterium]